MSLEDTKEFKHHIKTLPLIDNVYKTIWSNSKIKRFEYSANIILDKEYHIDTEITLQNGSKILGQEKCLSAEFSKYQTFTTEFYQNESTKEKGEFFNLAAQFYFHGYANKDYSDLTHWYIFRVLDLMLWLEYMSEQKLAYTTRPAGGSRASFLYIPYRDIPEQIIVAKKP